MENETAQKVANLISVNRIGSAGGEQACDREYIICGECLMEGFIELFSDEIDNFNEKAFTDKCFGLS